MTYRERTPFSFNSKKSRVTRWKRSTTAKKKAAVTCFVFGGPVKASRSK